MRRLFVVLFLLVALAPSASCGGEEGGAIEVAWVIRGLDDRTYTCREQGVEIYSLKLSIVPVEDRDRDLCEDGTVSACVFECPPAQRSTMRGATPFEIPSGEYYVSLNALDAQGRPMPAELVQVPAPIRVTIPAGQIRFLGVWQVVINVR